MREALGKSLHLLASHEVYIILNNHDKQDMLEGRLCSQLNESLEACLGLSYNNYTRFHNLKYYPTDCCVRHGDNLGH